MFEKKLLLPRYPPGLRLLPRSFRHAFRTWPATSSDGNLSHSLAAHPQHAPR